MKNTSRFHIARILGTIFLLAVANITFGQTPEQTDARELLPNQIVEREMTGKATHRYKFVLKKDEFFQVRVEQKGIDVALKLFDAEGRTLATMDSPNGRTGFETLSLIAEKAGDYILEIGGFDAKAEKGFYIVERSASRTATEDDKRRIAAQLEAAKARTFFDEGFALFNQGTPESFRAALIKFKEAGRRYRDIDDKSETAGLTVFVSGIIFDRLGEKTEALKFYESALKFFQANNYPNFAAAALTNLGQLHSDLGDKQKALEFFNQALPLLRQGGNQSGEARTLNNIGLVYFATGSQQAALENYNLALPLFRQIGDKSGEARTLTNIGAVYSLFGEKQKAIEFYSEALPIFTRIGDVGGAAATLNNIGAVYSDLGDKQKAMEFQNQALPLLRKIGDKSAEARALNNLGREYADVGDPRKALELYNQALSLLREVGDKAGEGQILISIGAAYDSMGELQKALEFYNQSLPILRQVDDKAGEAASFSGIGKVYTELKDGPKSIGYFNVALRLSRASSENIQEARTLNNLMYTWESLQNSRVAVFYGKQSVNKYQQLRQSIQGLSKELQRTFLKSVEDTYRKLADILIANGRIAEAEQVLDMLKEEEYFSYLRRDDKAAADLKSRIALSPDEKKAVDDYEKFAGDITRAAEEYESLKKKIPFGGTIESLPSDERKRYEELELRYNAATTVFNKFLDDLKIKFGKTDERVAKIESDTIGLLKKLNQPRTVIVSTIVGADRLNLIVTTSDVQKAHTVEIKAADLNKLVADFRETVKNPNLDPRPLGKRLYDKLFPAALVKDLENIKADTIVWSLDGTLRYVPMSALWDGEKYLVERYNQAVITLASRDKLESNQNLNRQNWLAFGVGVSKSFENFNSLPAVPKELCSVVKDAKQNEFCSALGETGVFGGVMLRDEEFTFDIFKQNLGKTPIVHVASHFALNPGEYDQSYLLLGGGANRKFSLVDVRNTRLDGIELLTLSACNTAMTSGNASNGLEVEGFGALAQKQGVKSVLATLWAVADDSTGKLMTDFYRILETNPSTGKAEALRNAQINLIKGANKPEQFAETRRSEIVRIGASRGAQPKFVKNTNAPFAHPYFWSSFVLIGNWK